MSFEIVLTTAENIVAVIDSVLAKPTGCDRQFVCDFTELTDSQAQNALTMAIQLSFLQFDNSSSLYTGTSFLSRLLVSADGPEQKAAILRLALEQYEPYITFKSRFIFTESADAAAKQLKVLYGFTTTYKDIKNTIISIATYSRSMTDQGANIYRLNPDTLSHISAVSNALSLKISSENQLINQLGSAAYDYIDKGTVFGPLSDAYSRSLQNNLDAFSIVSSAGNAFESFLVQLAGTKGISLVGKNGIIQKANALGLSKKHAGMAQYIGQIRNAADHGADVDESNNVWSISDETAKTYPFTVTNLIKNILAREHGSIVV